MKVYAVIEEAFFDYSDYAYPEIGFDSVFSSYESAITYARTQLQKIEPKYKEDCDNTRGDYDYEILERRLKNLDYEVLIGIYDAQDNDEDKDYIEYNSWIIKEVELMD